MACPQAGLEDLLLERIFQSREAAAARPRQGPAARVGQRCRVFWREDNDWYEAVCRAYDEQKRKHNLWYIYDEEVNSLLFYCPSLSLITSLAYPQAAHSFLVVLPCFIFEAS